MALNINSVKISGKDVHPIIEGGKGIGVSNGRTSGEFARWGGVGTFSGVNADFYDENGNIILPVYHGKTRKERHNELINMAITGGIAQAKIAHETSNGNGRIHINILWEMGGAEAILEGILQGSKGLVHGVTCGAGMPYRVAEIAEEHNIYYYPIVSSMRAFRALWKRSYHKRAHLLGGVVYEDPWLAGGHNGLSNSEDPLKPENPYPRVVEIRKFMNEVGLNEVPVIMAGGVWHLKDWEDWLNNPDIGPVAFQFGTRPILTQESPVSPEWKKKLLTLKEGDILLNKFSPTGFYSSAIKNDFIDELIERNNRQIDYRSAAEGEYITAFPVGPRGRPIYIKSQDAAKATKWISEGFSEAMKTPDSTAIFVSKDLENQIIKDQIDCMGCLSACRFSNWADHDDYTTGRKADPRSYCIQKTLQDAIRGKDIENQLMFSGHNAYRFANDPFYKDDFIPTIKQLVERILTGY